MGIDSVQVGCRIGFILDRITVNERHQLINDAGEKRSSFKIAKGQWQPVFEVSKQIGGSAPVALGAIKVLNPAAHCPSKTMGLAAEQRPR
ncbi:hypothetical protein D3C72_524280 [compost metagenome]